MFSQQHHNSIALNNRSTQYCEQQHDTIQIILENNPRRKEVEQFIATQFFKKHDAIIKSFMPCLLIITDLNDDIKAAIGVRNANQSELFLEHYFDQPIEHILINHMTDSPQNISRNNIVEVGNLASIDVFASRRLFKVLAFYLIQNNFKWVVFTGCQSLRLLFKKMKLKLVNLGSADPEKLPESLGYWGNYYNNNAQVMAGSLANGLFLAKQVESSLLKGNL